MKNLLSILLLLVSLSAVCQQETNNLKVNGDAFATGHVTAGSHIHSFCYRGESTILFAIDVADTWYHLTNATNDLFSDCELTGFTMSGDTLTVTGFSGDYWSVFHMNFLGVANKNYSCRIFDITKNEGIPVGDANAGAGTDIVSVDPKGYAEDIAIGDKIIIQVKNLDGTDDLTIKTVSWYVELKHR